MSKNLREHSDHTAKFYDRLAQRLESGEAEQIAWGFANRAIAAQKIEESLIAFRMADEDTFHLTFVGVLAATVSGILLGLGLPFTGYVIILNL